MTSNILKQFDTVSPSEEGAWLHLCAPGTDDPVYTDKAKKKPLRIRLKGPHSQTWVTFLRDSMRKGKKEEDQSYEDEILHDATLLAKMALGWENMPADVGECNEQNAVELFKNYKDIRVQALGFISNAENFTQRQPTD